jgi:hypothetical protein
MLILCHLLGPGYRSRYSESLWAGRSRDRILVGGDDSRTHPYRFWGRPSLPYSGYRVFPEVKAAWGGAKYPSHLRNWRNSGVIHLLPIFDLVACSGVKFVFTSSCHVVCKTSYFIYVALFNGTAYTVLCILLHSIPCFIRQAGTKASSFFFHCLTNLEFVI